MQKIFLATKNYGKIKEIREYLQDFEIKILSLNDFPDFPTTLEDGKSYEENALKKAVQGYKHTNLMCLADDSGLEIAYLNGQPGIQSSRWGKTDEAKNDKVLELLQGVPQSKRTAKFVCVLVLISDKGKQYVIREECHGEISFSPKGHYGFGYNPIFYVPEFKKTFAELNSHIKNRISHRGKALKKAVKIIKDIIR